MTITNNNADAVIDDDSPLDFESEDPLFIESTLPTRKRKNKVIELDDLLTNFYKDESKVIEQEAKKRSVRDCDESDEDGEVAELARFVDDIQHEVLGVKVEDGSSVWGLRIFGNQKILPQVSSENTEKCEAFLSFMNNELNGFVGLNIEEGQTFLEGLLINGWLLEVASARRHVEESVATWTFNLLLYSSKEDLRTSACDFWCSILTFKNETETRPIRIGWLPGYADLKGALETYGYLVYTLTDFSSLSEVEPTHIDSDGPPQNIRCWIKFLGACCQSRNTRSIFSTSEVEEFLIVLLCLFLDRQIQPLSILLYESLLAVTSFFTDDEWNFSYLKVAEYLSSRASKNLNCLRLVDCIATVDTRSKQLRSEVALQILLHFFDTNVSSKDEILSSLIQINLKDKKCDYFRVYIYLVLTENWLFSNPRLEKKPFVLEMWSIFLRNCSCQISRSESIQYYASKVRNKASYLLQSTAR